MNDDKAHQLLRDYALAVRLVCRKGDSRRVAYAQAAELEKELLAALTAGEGSSVRCAELERKCADLKKDLGAMTARADQYWQDARQRCAEATLVEQDAIRSKVGLDALLDSVVRWAKEEGRKEIEKEQKEDV